ncbi:hypothetical protein [Rubrivirga sp. IMCC45206]|uniref:hypothetical protein n=1 Tax=Rubrivirga sp. IMCC45206 TaxID=3391614 RepID=UPI00398FCC18
MSALRATLSAALLVVLASSATATPPTRDLNFTIRNHSSFTVVGLYTSGCDVTHWQPLTLSARSFPDGMLHPGQNVVYAFAPGCINVRLISAEGHLFDYGVHVTPYDVYEWAVTDDMISGSDYDDSYDDSYGDYDAGYGYIEVVNNNGYDAVKDVFFRHCGTEWDSDYLVDGELIRLEQSQAFEIPVGCWDAAIRLTSGEVVNWSNLNVQPDGTVRLRVPPSH